MEGLAAAASGIAVVSLAIQLAESVKKLSEFWNSIKEAPEDIQAMSRDLELLSSILNQIAYEAQHVEPDSTLVAALNGCWNKVKTLTKLLKEIEPGFASTSSGVRKWTAFKAVSKHGQLVKFQEAVERLKSTLLLVQQNQYSRSSRNRYLSLERKLDTITQGVSSLSLSTVSDGRNRHLYLEPKLDTITQSVSSLSMERYSIAEGVLGTVSDVQSNRAVFNIEEWDATKLRAGNLPRVGEGNPSNSDGTWRKQTWVTRTLREQTSVMEYFLGTIRAESNMKLRTARETDSPIPYCEKEHYEHETSYTIYPATWLIRLGIHYGLRLKWLSSSTQGWKNTLETICPVPDDALIFEFCKEGNISAVRRLLAGGHASVRDTDSQGYTPLHFAAQNHHPELCRILQGAGADTGTLTHLRETAIVLAAHESIHTTYAALSKIIGTLRLLTDSMDFSDESGDGWEVLRILCDSTREAHGETEAKIALLLWTLKLLSFELKTYQVRRQYARMLGLILRPHPGLEEASDLILNFSGAETIDGIDYGTEGYALLQKSIAIAGDWGRTSTILSRGPDLHRLSLDNKFTPQEETPTSLAMYSELEFEQWATGLDTIEVDLEKFIGQELQRNYVVHVGWEKETLLDLFAYDYTPEHYLRHVWKCCDCAKILVRRIRVQPYWRHLLERIKRKIDPDTPAQDHSEARETENADLGAIVEAASSSSDLAQKFDVSEKIPFADPGELPSESESESEEDIHGYPTTIPIQSDCMYARHEVVCMDCWIKYRRTGTRRPRPAWTQAHLSDNDSSNSSLNKNPPSRDESSEDEYSPYLIHT